MLKNWLATVAERVLNPGAKTFNKLEYKHKKIYKQNERAVEFAFAFKHIGRIYPKRVLDVGTGRTSFPHMIWTSGIKVDAIDNIKDYWSVGMVNRHFYVRNDDITNTKITQKYDLITCLSVIEHIKDYDKAISNIFSLLETGGHLILTCPYNEKEYCPNVYKLPGSSYGQEHEFVTQAISRKQVDGWLQQNNAEIIEQEFWQFWDGDFWTVGNQIIPPVKVDENQKHQLTCIIFKKK